MSLKSNASDVGWMIASAGWQIYSKELWDDFDRIYKELRVCSEKEKFYRLQGMLDGLERALKLPEIIQARGELQKE